MKSAQMRDGGLFSEVDDETFRWKVKPGWM